MYESSKKFKTYRILEPIEEGNYSIIYRAESSDRKVVVLKCARLPRPEYNELISREFQVLSQLQHPNIVKVFDYDIEADGTAFFSMAYVPGSALNKHFSGFSREFAAALLQVLTGLAAFHNRGFVHTDLKPEHIRYDPDEKKAVFIDFGFAGLSEKNLFPAGTFGYIAPEVLKGLIPDQRSDLYSLGVIIYEILAGRKPAPDDGPIPDIPDEINGLIRRLLVAEPALRPSLPELYRSFARSLGRDSVPPFTYRIDLPTLVFIEPDAIFEKIRTAKTPVIIFNGAPGTGKTRLLKEIKYRIQQAGNQALSYRAAEKVSLWETLTGFTGFTADGIRDIFAAFEGLCQALIRAGNTQKTDLIIDDADELGAHDLALVQYLGIGLAGSGIRIIGSARRVEKIRAVNASIFILAPFSPIAVRDYIDRTFAPLKIRSKQDISIPPADFANWLHDLTGGNPLFLGEILKILHAGKIMDYGPEGWQVEWDKLRRVNIPSRIDDILTALMNPLTDEERKLINILTVMNCPVEPSVLGRISGSPVDVRLENLKRLGLIREEFEGERRTVFPASRFIRAIAESDLAASERLGLEADIADALAQTENENIHYFMIRGRFCRELGRDEEARRYFEAAGEHAEKNFDYRSALDAFDQAAQLSRKTDPENYYRLRLRTAGLLKNLGLTDQARGAYREMIEKGPQGLRAAVLTDYGRFLCSIGEPALGAESLRESLSLMDENSPDYIRTANSLGYALMNTGRLAPAADLFEKALARARARQDKTEEATARYNQAIHTWFMNDLDRAILIAREGLDFCRVNDLKLDFAYFANILTTCHLSRNDLAAARENNDLAIEVFARIGHIQLLNSALQNKANLLYTDGDLRGSEKILKETMDRARQMDSRQDLYYALFTLGLIQEHYGQFAATLEYYRQSAEVKPEDDSPLYRIALVRFKLGDLEYAQEEFSRLNQKRELPDNHLGLALIYAQRAEWLKARVELDRAEQLLAANPDPHQSVNFLLAAGRCYLQEGDYDQAQVSADMLKKKSREDRHASTLADAFVKIAEYGRKRAPVLDLSREETTLKNMGYLYELGLMKKFALDVLYRIDRSAHWPEILAGLSEGEEIFTGLGCLAERDELQKFKARIIPDLAAELNHRSLTDPYLETFSRLAELISRNLGTEEFPDRILDLIIAATRAERGVLFVKRLKTMEMIAGRDMDKTTLQDAAKFSQSVLEKLDPAEIVFVPNALANPDFSLKKSVILNQIRSVLCIPLVAAGTIVGAIYLDSRSPDRIFDPRDRDFLQAVSRILAAVTEKSLVFGATREENVLLKSNIIREIGSGYLVGRSRAMKHVYKSVEDTAPTDLPVLILGETGTGKGMIARLIHLKSRRRDKRFLPINCGTIPETLLESELFGHKKGSFTGAVSDKRGLMEEAEGGTVFLDEITNTSLAFQAKLLEAIEEKTIRRVGETVTRKIDVRFLFATNRDLEIEVEEGRFRKDLFYRINVFEVEIPPLRDRRNDIPHLAQLFLDRFRREINKKIDGFTAEALSRLKNNFWPGNVRELQNVIERSVIQAKSRLITAEDIGDRNPVTTDGKTIKLIKKEAILEELKTTNGNTQKAAKNLGINRRTIQRYIKQYKIQI